MSLFKRALEAHRVDPTNRRWIFVPYDQLTDAVGPLSRSPARDVGIVLVECPAKAARRPYHKQKLAWVLTNLRHFALEQAARGVAVRHLVASSYAEALQGLGPISVMRPAERELRAELAPLVASGQLSELEHEGWLTTREDFELACTAPPFRMDAFYRHVRRRLGVLMAGGKPLGGRFSFDGENRQAWSGDPPAPPPPTFVVDDITREVIELIQLRMAHHPGTLTPEAIPATKADVERVWTHAKDACLEHFGPYEDAMSLHAPSLFHTRISALLNLQRLSVHRVVREVEALSLPLPSKEGFLRQVLGWREFVRHVHEATDGFRTLSGVAQPCAASPGDGGYATWKKTPWVGRDAEASGASGGGSVVSVLGAQRPVPPAFWGAPSGLACLDGVVASVWKEAYSHHITRLMVLSNIATLLDIAPRELTDWFWVAYVDAFDWVVEPNVHGMGTFGLGDLLTTKPYVSGAAYIDKMSDFCTSCRFHPKKTCPVTPMYWAFLGRHREALARLDRMKLPLASEAKRSDAQKRADAATYERVAEVLARGDALEP